MGRRPPAPGQSLFEAQAFLMNRGLIVEPDFERFTDLPLKPTGGLGWQEEACNQVSGAFWRSLTEAVLLRDVPSPAEFQDWCTLIDERCLHLLQAFNYQEDPSPPGVSSSLGTMIPTPKSQALGLEIRKLMADARSEASRNGWPSLRRSEPSPPPNRKALVSMVSRLPLEPEENRSFLGDLITRLDVVRLCCRIARDAPRPPNRMSPERHLRNAICYYLMEAYQDLYEGGHQLLDGIREPAGHTTLWVREVLTIVVSRLPDMTASDASALSTEAKRWVEMFNAAVTRLGKATNAALLKHLRAAWEAGSAYPPR